MGDGGERSNNSPEQVACLSLSVSVSAFVSVSLSLSPALSLSLSPALSLSV